MYKLNDRSVRDVSNSILDLVLNSNNTVMDDKSRKKLLRTIIRLVHSIEITSSDELHPKVTEKKEGSGDGDIIGSVFHPMPPIG